ncbi:hypothetical protein FB382_002381 [Nocardioides ginsengisegetis]|uniref:Secreted protein n=1 Tax=Nocardioides ginsengisegetis TaxID=661491 RepID=A0A7W3P9U9_9ACTN|nr:hypothetical protein [Nocardioides ginsengisegetis]MBA8804090.1 hypothetical protein [Nocardioides ginsengisegetis]
MSNHTPRNVPRRPGRRLRTVGAAAAVLGLAATFHSTGGASAATLPSSGDDLGPVGTDPGASSLLQTLLQAATGVVTDTSKVAGRDGKTYWIENHIESKALPASALDGLGLPSLGGIPAGDSGGTVADDGIRREYLVVWAGDNNVLDKSGAELTALPKSVGTDLIGQKDLVGPDFFAVVDATKGSPSYGTVVNTATVGPLVENEPHHMQYIWHKGNNIFAGGLFTDVTYVVDTSQLPKLTLKAVNLPQDTVCGSVPDAYWVTKDGDAYGTYMGGPDLPGPCTYTDGSVRVGNGFGGSPGELVRLDKDGKTLSEAPAATETPEDTQRCDNIPALPAPTCANPHGVQAREDLGILVSSDYNEPRNIILNPVSSPSSYLRRPTVRTWDISDEDHPKLKAVSFLPDGPRVGKVPHQEEPRAAMETTVTNLPGHKGAFAETMQGGAIYYAPDITAEKPEWREVFDLTTSNKLTDPNSNWYGGGSNGGWLQTSLDDKYLYHAVVGRQPSGDDKGSPPYILKLDIQKLLASGDSPQCNIDTLDEVTAGGAESDCPAVVDTLPAPGGPHWGALDNLQLGEDGYYHETTDVRRIAYSNYFVARTGLNGDHRVCLADVLADETLALDTKFRDTTGETCIDFDRASWPHGDWGPAKPHSMLFVTADDDVK